MAVLSADLHKGMNLLWDNHGLNNSFKVNWALADRTQFEALNDQEAAPGTPFPYCIFEQSPGVTLSRMSASVDTEERREVRDIPWSFRIHSKQIEGNSSTAKELAADLADAIIKIVGGHPTVVPFTIPLDHGNVLQTQYQTDYGIDTGDEEYEWFLAYLIRVDIPVAL